MVTVPTLVEFNAQEQLFLELTNAARYNPDAMADLFAIDLNADVAAYQTGNGDPVSLIAATAKQALAPNLYIRAAAEGHSDWMLANNIFSHKGDVAQRDHPDYPGSPSYTDGSSPGERMAAAGYDFGTGAWTWGENIAWTGTTGTLDADAAILSHFEGLFRSVGHRLNTMEGDFREAGVAQELGVFTAPSNTGALTDFNASMLTNKFGTVGTGVFVTGVVFDDTNEDFFYSIGEGLGGVTIAAQGGSTTSMAAGGYALDVVSTSMLDVTLTRAGTAYNVTVDASYGNVKLDLVNIANVGWVVASDQDLTLGEGTLGGGLYGISDLTLTGNDLDNLLSGGQGDDMITGGAGTDSVRYFGDQSDYTVTIDGGTVTVTDSDTSAAGDGTDTLMGVETLVFNDTTMSVAISATVDVMGNVSYADIPGSSVGDLEVVFTTTSGTAFTATTDDTGIYTMSAANQAGQLSINAPQSGAREMFTTQDAMEAFRMAKGHDLSTGSADAFDFIAGDVTQDGTLDTQDVREILRYGAGLEAEGVGTLALVENPSASSAASVMYDDARALTLVEGQNYTEDLVVVMLGNTYIEPPIF